VVHIDGNRVGERLRRFVETKAADDCPNTEFASALSDVSKAIDTIGRNALQHVLQRVSSAVRLDEDGRPELHSTAVNRSMSLVSPSGAAYLPVRPLYFGGDDLTLICDGRIALDLARTLLEAYQRQTVADLDGKITACAGVALIGSHAPFSRGYALAKSLVRSAKDVTSDGKLSAIDWHIAQDSMLEPLAVLRERQYRSPCCTLTLRPYRLDAPLKTKHFVWLDEQLLGDAGDHKPGLLGANWQRSRNKLKTLRTLISDGPLAVREAMADWKLTAKVPDLPAELHQHNGFDGLTMRTPLLDAIELMDIHLPLR